MDLLINALEQALALNAKETDRWTTYKEEHKNAEKNLFEFQKSLEIDIMVPIGTKALIPGKLYHTNEVFLNHSRGIFSNCSSHNAIRICKHRIELADKRLKDLGIERDMYQSKLELPFDSDVFSSKNQQEIIEDYDEEKERKWRDEHKERVKEFKLKESQERNAISISNDDKDIFNALDELELMEELDNELENLNVEKDDMFFDNLMNEMKTTNSTENQEKKRISHFKENNNNNNNNAINASIQSRIIPKSCLEKVSYTNNNNIVNEHDFNNVSCDNLNNDNEDTHSNNDSDNDSYDDDIVPQEFRDLEKQCQNLPTKNKIKFFTLHLNRVQQFISGTKIRNPNQLDYLTEQYVLRDYLVSVIENLQDEIATDNYIKQIDSSTLPSSSTLATSSTLETSLTISPTTSSTISTPPSPTSPNSPLSPIFPDNNYDVDGDDNLQLNNIINNIDNYNNFNYNYKKNNTYNTFNNSYNNDSNELNNTEKRRISFGSENSVINFHADEEPYKLYKCNDEPMRHEPRNCNANDEDQNFDLYNNEPMCSKDLTMEIKFQHSDREYVSINNESNIIQNPSDIYQNFAHCMKMTPDQIREKNKMIDFVKRIADFDMANMKLLNSNKTVSVKDDNGNDVDIIIAPNETHQHIEMKSSGNQILDNNNKASSNSNNNNSSQRKSILKNKEAVHQEIHLSNEIDDNDAIVIDDDDDDLPTFYYNSIRRRETIEPIQEEDEQPRKISKFKASRMKN